MNERKFTVGSLVKHPHEILVKKEIEVGKNKETVKRKAGIEVTQHGQLYRIEVSEGKQTLLEAALEQNQGLDYKCQKGNCGKCLVKITNGAEFLSSVTEKEREKLGDLVTKGDARLACQVSLLRA